MLNTAFNHPDFAQPMTYSVMPLPEDSADGQVAATISVMKGYAQQASRSAAEQQLAQQLLAECSCPADYVQAVFNQAKQRMYFQRDEQTAGPTGEGDVVELVLRPSDVLAMTSGGNKVPGDCDCFSTFVASLLLAAGVDCAFATSDADTSNAGRFGHVYVVAWPGDLDNRVVVDASHGPYVGWEAPHQGKYQEWPLGMQGGKGCAELVLLALIFVAGICFDWGTHNSRRELTA